MRKVSDIVKLLGVDKETVKKWCYEFNDYLSSTATPPKGQTRFFDDSDVQTLALIFYYWEDDPDYEAIHSHLNSGSQNNSFYLDFVDLNTSIFRDPPVDEIGDRYEYCVMLNGEFLRSPKDVAQAYKTAGDALVEQAVLNYYPYELAYPIFFNYRHTIELYLKLLTGFDFESDKSHDLAILIKNLEEQYKAKLPGSMKARLEDFHKIDPGSFTFRYPASYHLGSENRLLWIDLFHLKKVMKILCEGFEQLLKQQDIHKNRG